MNERVLISLEKNADSGLLAAALRRAGAGTIEPIESLPDTLLAMVDEEDVDAFLERARDLAGVRHAERDSMRYSS
jgi:hypothetical protein